MARQIRRPVDDHECRSAVLQAAPHGDCAAFAQLFDGIAVEKEGRDALRPGAGQFLRQHIAGSFQFRLLVASRSRRQADRRIDIGQCRRRQREPAAARIAGDNYLLVPILARFGDALCHEGKNFVVVLLKIGKALPVDPQNVPGRDLGHLGEDRRDGIAIGILRPETMEIEEEPTRPGGTESFDGGGLPFGPDRIEALRATGSLGQQQSGHDDRC